MHTKSDIHSQFLFQHLSNVLKCSSVIGLLHLKTVPKLVNIRVKLNIRIDYEY